MQKIEAVIVSGFPGVGKSTFFANPGDFTILDSDSSNFSWLYAAKRVRHPSWPQNYIDHIRANRNKVDIILVSSHKETRDALVQASMAFFLVYPSLEMKAEYLGRYIQRGNNEQFVKLLDTNYETWIRELMLQEGCEHVVLQPGQYLSDVTKQIRQ